MKQSKNTISADPCMEYDFYEAFKKNMEALGLQAPKELFGTKSKAVASIAAIAKAVKTYGPNMPVKEIFGTIPLTGGAVIASSAILEILMISAAISGAFYLGACIGSLGVAAYKGKACALSYWSLYSDATGDYSRPYWLAPYAQKYSLSA